MTTISVVTAREFCCLLPLKFLSASMKSACLRSLRIHHLIPVPLAVAVVRSAKIDWTGLGSMDTRFPYHWETDEIFDLPEGCTTVFCRHPLGGDAPFTRRPLMARDFRFALDLPLSMSEAGARAFGSNGAPGSASDAMGRDFC